jgi:hypothetical protein
VFVGPAHVLFAITAIERRDESLLVEAARQGPIVGEVLLPELEFLAFDSAKSAVAGECDATFGIEPGVPFVIAKNRELSSVDGAKLVNREAELERGECVDFYERPAAFEGVADGTLARPRR